MPHGRACYLDPHGSLVQHRRSVQAGAALHAAARLASTGGLELANPIYREIIPRVLASTAFASLPRMDLCLRHGLDTLALELNVWRDGEKDPLQEGLAQLDGYLSGLGLSTGWLVIFDRRGNQPPIAERTHATPVLTPAGRRVTLVRA